MKAVAEVSVTSMVPDGVLRDSSNVHATRSSEYSTRKVPARAAASGRDAGGIGKLKEEGELKEG